MPRARALGLLDAAVWARFEQKLAQIDAGAAWARARELAPDAATSAAVAALGLSALKNKTPVAGLLQRPEVGWAEVRALCPDAPALPPEVEEQVVTDLKYAGYLIREEARGARARRMEHWRLPAGFDWALPGLSTEVAERLRAARPETLGAAARLPGVTPAAVDVLAVHLARQGPAAPA
jgi:tRNA uridine 5-carboxymethylaminomethyl modification enzyme